MPVQITNQYWICLDTNPTTQVWSGPLGQFVSNTDATFETWLNANDGRADQMNGGTVVATANNGAGLVRVEVTSGQFQTGQIFNFVGNNSGAAGAAAITAIDATHFDIQGSTFTIADSAGIIWSATLIDMAANLYQDINSYNISLYLAGQFLGTNVLTGGANVTLTNPMVGVQDAQFSGSATRKIILPKMNVPGSIPIGMPVFVLNDSVTLPNSANVQIFAQDGVTQIGQTLPFGLSTILTLKANDSQNGTFTPGVRSLTNDSRAAWNVLRGGTGNQSLTNHGILIGQGTVPLNVTAAMTDGQLLIGQSGADPAPETVSGDASLAASGALTVTGTGGVPFGPFATLAAPLAIVYGGTQTTVAPAAGQVLIAQSASLYAPISLTSGATLTAGGTVVLGNPGAAQLGGVFSYASVANQFLTSLSTSGSLAGAQPAVSGLSGLPVAIIYGGTQTTVAPSSGQVLIAQSGSLYSPTSLTGGATLAASGTVILANPSTTVRGGLFSRASVASQFLVSLDTSGSLTSAQPAISGLAELPVAIIYGGTQTTVAPTSGQVLVAQSGSLYSPKSLVGGATLTAGGTVVLGNPGAAQLGGIFSYASVANQFLVSLATSGSLTGAQPAFSNLSGVAAISQGGTNQTAAPSAGQVLIAQSGTAFAPMTLSGGATVSAGGTVTLGAPGTAVLGGLYSFASVSNQFLTSLATSGSLAAAQPVLANLSGSLNLASQVTGTLAVANGGTGAATLTAHGVLLGEGTSAVVATAAMTNGQLLIGQTSADPLPKTMSGDATTAASGAITVTGINGVDQTAAYTTYTPTVTATSGTFTTVSASGLYKQIGKTVLVQVNVTITTIGTAAGRMLVTLPASTTPRVVGGRGAEVFGWTDVGGAGAMRACTGGIFDASDKMSVARYDGTFPGTSGDFVLLNFVYEAN